MFKIWCEVYGGITGHRTGFMKKRDGTEAKFETCADAKKELPKSHTTDGGVTFRYRIVPE